jgi:hypothetical protein
MSQQIIQKDILEKIREIRRELRKVQEELVCRSPQLRPERSRSWRVEAYAAAERAQFATFDLKGMLAIEPE